MANIKDNKTDWQCVNCDNVVSAKVAPNKCPVCSYTDIPWSGSTAYVLKKEDI